MAHKNINEFTTQPRQLFIKMLAVYQQTLSPDHGWGRFILPNAGCRYYPSCSEYTKQAVHKYGVGHGLWLGLKRLGKCHPFSHGGYEPVK